MLIGVGGVFVESGLVAALIQRPGAVEEAANSAFVAIVLAGLALSVTAAATSPVVGLVFGSHQVGLIALALSGLLVVGAFKAIPDALMQRRFSFLRRVVVDPLGAAAFGAATIAGLAGGLGVWALVIGAYASEAAQAASSWYLSRWRPNLRLASTAIWRELAGYGRYILAGNIVDHVGLAANAVLLGRFVSQSALGQYRYAARFGVLPHELVVNVASYVLMPAFSRLAPHEERFAAALRRSLRWMLCPRSAAERNLRPARSPDRRAAPRRALASRGDGVDGAERVERGACGGSLAAAALKGAGRPRILTGLHLLHGFLAIGLDGRVPSARPHGHRRCCPIAAVAADSVAVAAAVRVAGAKAGSVVTDLVPALLAAGTMIGLLLPLDRLALHADRPPDRAGLVLLAGECAAGFATYLLVLSRSRLRSGRSRSSRPYATGAGHTCGRPPNPAAAPAGSRRRHARLAHRSRLGGRRPRSVGRVPLGRPSPRRV